MTIFAHVVDAGSLSGAARRLNLSRSTVSKQIAQLENRLGARLVQRTTRRLSLTEVGVEYYARCTRIVHEVEDAEQSVGHLHATPRGLLRVNAPMSFGQRHIAPVIAEFLRCHPNVQLELTLDDQVVNMVESGFDVSIRVARLADSALIARRLAPNRVVVCGSPAYFAAHQRPRTPRDLGQHNCLHYTLLASRNAWRFAGPRGERLVEVSGSLRANNGDVLQMAARDGVGLVQLPTFIVGPDLANGVLETVLDAFADDSTSIWALYPSARHLSPKARAVLDFFGARFAGRPYWDETACAAPRHGRRLQPGDARQGAQSG
jgi:DNA-binding transcriptional LysR family regulator